MEYEEFLQSKMITTEPSGFTIDPATLPGMLYPYQSDLVQWACKRGKAALFTLTGTGKTAMQVSWADQVQAHTAGNVLILAPLAVAKQTVNEAAKFGIHVNYVRHASEVKRGISIANYEMLHHFEECEWAGIVVDESGIIKEVTGKYRNQIIEQSKTIPFRLACSATPAPNSYPEIGNHAELLGICSYREMLTTFFVNDVRCDEGWRLKKHAESKFFEWMASWAVFLTTPSDLGYSDDGFQLPTLHTFQHIVGSTAPEGALFAFEVRGLQERQAARRASLEARVEKAAQIVKESAKPFMVWCDLNAESEALLKAIPGAVQITGSDSAEYKEKTILDFAAGGIEVLVSKPSIIGRGMNLQVCSNLAFVGLSDSFEAIFQATKRFHRHGQKNEVNRHIIISEAEGPVLANVNRKETDFMRMVNTMVAYTRSITIQNMKQLKSEKNDYICSDDIIIPQWLITEVI